MKKIIFGDDKNIVYTKLKEIRLAKSMSQSALAAKLQTMNVNMDQQMISKIENNDRIVTDYELLCLATALNVDVTDLLDDLNL